MDGIEFMEKCSQEKPDIRFVVLTFYEEFSYAQSVIRWVGWIYFKGIPGIYRRRCAAGTDREKYEERSREAGS